MFNRRYFRAIVLSVLIVLFLTVSGCGMSAKTDAEVVEEIRYQFEQECSYLPTFDNISVVIDQRQTNAQEKTDYVWASIVATNDYLEYAGSCYAGYVCYNDGWALSFIDFDDFRHSVQRSTVSEEDAEKVIAEHYGGVYDEITLDYRDTNLMLESDTFIYLGTYTDGYVTVTDEIEVRYRHKLNTGWDFVDVSSKKILQEWDVLGKWVCKSDGNDLWIDIIAFEDNIITVEFDFDYTCGYDSAWYGWKEVEEHYASDGVETRTVWDTDVGTRFQIIESNYKSYPCVFLSETQGITFDGLSWLDNDTFVFTRVDG